MTNEEISLKADEACKEHNGSANYRYGYYDGAKWMQEKMIEKATRFIYDTIFGWTGGSVTKTWNQCRDEYVDRLKQAMEE